jgi:hypothetical protein
MVTGKLCRPSTAILAVDLTGAKEKLEEELAIQLNERQIHEPSFAEELSVEDRTKL